MPCTLLWALGLCLSSPKDKQYFSWQLTFSLFFSLQPGPVEVVPAHGWEVGTRWSLRFCKVPSMPDHSVMLWLDDIKHHKPICIRRKIQGRFQRNWKKNESQMKTTNTNSSTKALFRLGEVQQASAKRTVRVGYWKVCFLQKSSALSIKQPEYFQP